MQEFERANQVGLQLAAKDYGVYEAFFQQELGALKVFGELLTDGLLDDAGAGKAYQGAGFGDVSDYSLQPASPVQIEWTTLERSQVSQLRQFAGVTTDSGLPVSDCCTLE